MAKHKLITAGRIHVAHNWEFADATARAALADAEATDVYKLALQLDDLSLWILTAVTPTWEQVTGFAGTVTNNGGDLTANAVVLGAATSDSKVVGGVTTDGVSRLQLGVAGTSVGGVELRNATSGTVSIVPPTGALGTAVITTPIGSVTLASLTGSESLTNKKLGSLTTNGLVTTSGSDGTLSVTVLGTGVSTLLTTAADGTSASAIGYQGIPQNSKSAAYTIAASDNGKHIYHPSADTSARTWTIDSNANLALPIGFAVTFVNDASAGVITIAITTDTMVLAGTGTTGSRTLAANGIATAIKMTSTRWQISGVGLT